MMPKINAPNPLTTELTKVRATEAYTCPSVRLLAARVLPVNDSLLKIDSRAFQFDFVVYKTLFAFDHIVRAKEVFSTFFQFHPDKQIWTAFDVVVV